MRTRFTAISTARLLLRPSEIEGGCVWAIAPSDAADGRTVGRVQLWAPVPGGRQAELTYALLPMYAGSGFMGEALAAVCDFAFRTGGFDLLTAAADAQSDAENLLRQLGFTCEQESETDEKGQACWQLPAPPVFRQDAAELVIPLPEEVWQVLQALEAKGHEAYVVGGCVRDSLLGLAPGDWDICTSALPEEVTACFPAKNVIATGIKHGMVTVLRGGRALEVTTYRQDGPYHDKRHPSGVVFVRLLKEDLARRDFTVNAMAYHPRTGIADPYGGLADLRAGTLRAVGDARQRFEEDALRILRALRFAGRLGLTIEPGLAAAIHECRELLRFVSAERVAAELCGILRGVGARQILTEYADVLAVPVPEILPCLGAVQNNPYHDKDVWTHTAAAVASAPPDDLVRLAAFFHDMGKPACLTTSEDGVSHFYGHAQVSEKIADAVLRRLRFSNADREEVCRLVKRHDIPLRPTPLARWLGRLGETTLRRLIKLKRADVLAHVYTVWEKYLPRLIDLEEETEQLLRQGAAFSLKDLAVNGDDVMAAGLPQGKQVGRALQHLLDAVLDGKIENTREALLAELSKQLQSGKNAE